jgi:hypothetical protein
MFDMLANFANLCEEQILNLSYFFVSFPRFAGLSFAQKLRGGNPDHNFLSY